MTDNTAAQTAPQPGASDKIIRYSLFFIVMGLYTLPLPIPLIGWEGIKFMPPAIFDHPILLLAVHEFSGFLFFGHTLFSNIWAMRVRMVGDQATGIMARSMLRVMALSITMPTSIISPLFGVWLLNGYFGGFEASPWALHAYVAFWLMAALQLVPDIIRYAVDTHKADPKRDVRGAALRGIGSTFLTFYIIWCMVTKTTAF
ncbi:MAG: hypothetical protein HKN56_11160 [Gammaproteobacteria bacterium]|nr:hypothetical protein [Gammaproteobacteria bacterium]NND55512.1 hypothetical protein [Gammaproteobacteria bacterium]